MSTQTQTTPSLHQTGSHLVIDLNGPEGNALFILGATIRLLKQAGRSKEEISLYFKEAMSDDYDHLLETTRKVVELEII